MVQKKYRKLGGNPRGMVKSWCNSPFVYNGKLLCSPPIGLSFWGHDYNEITEIISVFAPFLWIQRHVSRLYFSAASKFLVTSNLHEFDFISFLNCLWLIGYILKKTFKCLVYIVDKFKIHKCFSQCELINITRIFEE